MKRFTIPGGVNGMGKSTLAETALFKQRIIAAENSPKRKPALSGFAGLRSA